MEVVGSTPTPGTTSDEPHEAVQIARSLIVDLMDGTESMEEIPKNRVIYALSAMIGYSIYQQAQIQILSDTLRAMSPPVE